MFFRTRKSCTKTPRYARLSPRSHHQKTTRSYAVFAKTLQKRHLIPQKKTMAEPKLCRCSDAGKSVGRRKDHVSIGRPNIRADLHNLSLEHRIERRSRSRRKRKHQPIDLQHTSLKLQWKRKACRWLNIEQSHSRDKMIADNELCRDHRATGIACIES